jgi:hypothetical protein
MQLSVTRLKFIFEVALVAEGSDIADSVLPKQLALELLHKILKTVVGPR